MKTVSALKGIWKDAALVVFTTSLILGIYYGATDLWRHRHADNSYITDAIKKVSTFPSVRLGATVAMKRLGLKGDHHAFVIISSPTCPHCKDSGAFQRKLLHEAEQGQIPIVLALPNAAKDINFAFSLGLQQTHIVDWEAIGLKPMGTPQILLVDQKGKILKFWLGHLDQASETDVMKAISYPLDVTNAPRKLPSGESMLTESDIGAIAKTESINILNIGQRNEFYRSDYNYNVMNIPFDELPLRAKYELDKKAIQIVDCNYNVSLVICELTVRRLKQDGYRAVAMDSSATDQIR
jgi:hypothetical protein